MRVRWALALVAIVWSCAGTGTRITLDEYSIEAPAEAAAGRIALTVRNAGSIAHELVILRTRLAPGELPVEDAEVRVHRRGVELVKQTPRIKAGKSRMLEVRLRPGSYVLICNVPGHYQSGMRAPFRAR
jgi:uncharacterized cupredoxin-like copper-binding protein